MACTRSPPRFAMRNIEIMEAEQLVDRAAATGAYLLDGLHGLKIHKLVGDVRGKGLLIGVELVKDRTTKEPVDATQITGIVEFCWDRGLRQSLVYSLACGSVPPTRHHLRQLPEEDR